MKKFLILILCLFAYVCIPAEQLLLINPFRETFIHFPSDILPEKIVTVFLPEEKVPLQQKYPVVYLLGVGPTDRVAAQQVLDRAHQKAILVGINVTEEDLQNPDRVEKFLLHDLMPYIDSNYPTLDEPNYRAIAAQGVAGTRVLSDLLSNNQLVTRAVVVNATAPELVLENPTDSLRILVAGSREKLVSLFPALQRAQLAYGPGFVTFISDKATLLGMVQLDYLFAKEESLRVQQVKEFLSDKTISLQAAETAVQLTAFARLANGLRFDYIPLQVRLSPPYLSWNQASGKLTVVPGAMPGKVKISFFVDNLELMEQIKLKK